MLELYHAGLTACSKKARICLKEKGLKYVSRFVDLGRFEQHGPEYLRLNPNGLVPTLVHDGAIIVDSNVINEYLDDVFPEVPLRPADPVARARCRAWSKVADEALGPNMVVAFSGPSAIGRGARALAGDALEERLSRIPLIERRDAIEKVARNGGFSADEFAGARRKAGAILDRIEVALADGPYLAGADYSLADINLVPFIDRYRERVVPDAFGADRLPRTTEWLERVLARPAVKAAFEESEETRRPAA